jgi:hypothetical protein
MTERERRGGRKSALKALNSKQLRIGAEVQSPGQQPAPDALDESRDTVHCVAVVCHDAAHAPLHVHQTPVAAGEKQ